MAELPEIQAFAHKLSKMLVGSTVIDVCVNNCSILNDVRGNELVNFVKSQTVQSVTSCGKYTELKFTSGDRILIHLALNGNMNILSHEYNAFDISLIFDSNLALSITDAQHLAKIYYCTADETFKRCETLGPEATSDEFTAKYLKLWCGGRNTAIKAFLLDQKYVAGIGNTYVDDILYKACVDPSRKARSLSMDECSRVVECAKTVLNSAVEYALSISDEDISLKEIEHATHKHLIVTRGANGVCPVCKSRFNNVIISGHYTYYCPVCQK